MNIIKSFICMSIVEIVSNVYELLFYTFQEGHLHNYKKYIDKML